MEKKASKIHILGAGISGLIAAKTLEKNGYRPTILEMDSRVGGRVKTDEVQQAYFDHGFQVLLTAYPEVKKHLDLSDLQLHYFKPGALLFDKGKRQRIGDPLRDISALWPTLVSTAGTLKDKLKIFLLSRKLKRKSLNSIFEEKEKTTLEYLKDYGFSNRIIKNFFKPFFAGIFLEDKLDTSSRMFEFVFKMFSEGQAALPEKGIGAVAQQLASQLQHTKFDFAKSVSKITDGKIFLDSGNSLDSNGTITTFPMGADGDVKSDILWKGCYNLYFETEQQVFSKGIIGLICHDETLTNNLHYLFDTETPILSVTVVKTHQLSADRLAQEVSKELELHCGIKTTKLLRHYYIPQALPDISNIRTMPDTDGIIKGMFVAGDYTLNGSLNAAMISGEAAAESLSEYLEKTQVMKT